MRLGRCPLLTRQPLTGTWFRAIRPQHYQTALAYTHTRTIPGRFNAGSVQRPEFPVLYLAEDQILALFEVNALLGSPLPGQAFAPHPAQPWTVINVRVRLRSVVDLCPGSQRRLIKTTVQELTGDWRGYYLRAPKTQIPTQRLGATLHSVRDLEGFVNYSAKVPTRRNLVVFPDKLRTGSFVRFTDPTTGQTHSVP